MGDVIHIRATAPVRPRGCDPAPLVTVVGFAGLTAWCVLVEVTEFAYRRRARRGEPVPLPYARGGRR